MKNNNNKEESGGQMGCYVIVTNRLFIGETGELSMEKASGSTAKVSSNIVKKPGDSKLTTVFTLNVRTP